MLNETSELYYDKDNNNIRFPASLESSLAFKVNWLRPYEIVRNYLIEKEIRSNFPNKQLKSMKQEIKDYYYNVELLLRKVEADHTRKQSQENLKEKETQEVKANNSNKAHIENKNLQVINSPAKDHTPKSKTAKIQSFTENKNSQPQPLPSCEENNLLYTNNIKKDEVIYFENKEDQNGYLNNENLNSYKNHVLDTVASETLNSFNEYNTNVFNAELSKYDNSGKSIHNSTINTNGINLARKSILISEAKETFNMKRNIYYKGFFKYFETPLKLRVVTITERNETAEEHKQRLEKEETKFTEGLQDNNKKIKADKKANAPAINHIAGNNANFKNNLYNNDSSTANILKDTKKNFNLLENANAENLSYLNDIKIKELKPSNMYYFSGEKSTATSAFTKWLTSIFQLILDLKLNDAYTEKSLFYNIYPQRNNFPTVSPSGRYWIKLYFMGKPRKVEIDDRIPCNENEDFVFPRCESLEEIWPALLTKAILKLHSYKYLNKSYNEIADLSYIYSLLGLHGDKIGIFNTKNILPLDYFLLMENDNISESFKLTLNSSNLISHEAHQSHLSKISSLACLNISNEELRQGMSSNNINFPVKKNFNFNFDFKVLDLDKAQESSLILKNSRAKANLQRDENLGKATKPKFSNVMNKIFANKKTPIPRPSLRAIDGLLLLKKIANSETFSNICSNNNNNNNNNPDLNKETNNINNTNNSNMPPLFNNPSSKCNDNNNMKQNNIGKRDLVINYFLLFS